MTRPPPSTSRLAHIVEQLLERARHDPEQVKLLQDLAQEILSTFPLKINPEPLPSEAPVELASDNEIDTFVTSYTPNPTPTPLEPEAPAIADVLLEELPARLQLKARACSWLAEHGYTQDRTALEARYSLIEEAKHTNCYLWMLDIEQVNPNNALVFREAADAYAALAQALEQWVAVETPGRDLSEVSAILQAGLRERVMAIREGQGLFFDEDQQRVFAEIKAHSQTQQYYLYGLALKDTITRERYETARTRLQQLHEAQGRRNESEAIRQAAFSRLRYHAQLLNRGSRKPEHDWSKIAEAVDALTGTGLPESDSHLRAQLEPLARHFPEASPHPQLERILGEAARVARERAARQAERDRKRTETQPPEVLQVAKLLNGRTLVILGGRPNDAAIAEIELAFDCRVNWLKSKVHESPKRFEDDIKKTDVLVVLLLIRWSSHVFSNVDAFCQKHGKHLVRVGGGYNPKRLAQDILGQAGERLSLKHSSQ